MDDVIIKAVTDIANAICKKKGYANRIREGDVSIVLEALTKLEEEIRKEKKK